MNSEAQLGRLSDHIIKDNPDFPCPAEILARQVGIRIMYMNFEGDDKTGIIEVHENVAQDIEDFFKHAYAIGFPLTSVMPTGSSGYSFDDAKLMDNNVTSGFNYRSIAGSSQLSAHALGLAIDVNPKSNPIHYFNEHSKMTHKLPARGNYNPTLPGTFLDDHELVNFMRDRGWEWGGDWTKESGRIDRHHFQKLD